MILEFSHQVQGTEQDTVDTFQEKLQELVDHIDKYPTLNGGHADIINAMVEGLTMPVKYVENNMNWWTQIISLIVREGHTTTNAELT